MDRLTASSLRQRLYSLRQERDRLEEEILQIRSLLRGCLLKRHFLAGGERRGTPAFYLFRRDSGRKRFIYIRKAHLERASREAEAYRRYRKALLRLRSLGKEILRDFKLLGEAQEVPPPG